MMWQVSQRMSTDEQPVLYHADHDFRLVVDLRNVRDKIEAEEEITTMRIYPCRECGWAMTCEECHS